MFAFNFFGADMSATKPGSKAKAQRNSQANVDQMMRLSGALKGAFSDAPVPIKIGTDDFVVYERGDLATFKKLMRNHKSPPPLKKGQFDVLGYLRAARDGDCGY